MYLQANDLYNLATDINNQKYKDKLLYCEQLKIICDMINEKITRAAYKGLLYKVIIVTFDKQYIEDLINIYQNDGFDVKLFTYSNSRKELLLISWNSENKDRKDDCYE